MMPISYVGSNTVSSASIYADTDYIIHVSVLNTVHQNGSVKHVGASKVLHNFNTAQPDLLWMYDD